MKNLVLLAIIAASTIACNGKNGTLKTVKTEEGIVKVVNTVKHLEGTSCEESETETLITECEEIANPLLLEDGERVIIGGEEFEMKDHGVALELWNVGEELARNNTNRLHIKTSIGVDGLNLKKETYDVYYNLHTGNFAGLDASSIVTTYPTLELNSNGEPVLKLGNTELLIETL